MFWKLTLITLNSLWNNFGHVLKIEICSVLSGWGCWRMWCTIYKNRPHRRHFTVHCLQWSITFLTEYILSYIWHNVEALAVFWRNKAFTLGKQRSQIRGTKAIFGNREYWKLRFWFWGTEEQSHLFQGNKGKGTAGRTSLYAYNPYNPWQNKLERYRDQEILSNSLFLPRHLKRLLFSEKMRIALIREKEHFAI